MLILSEQLSSEHSRCLKASGPGGNLSTIKWEAKGPVTLKLPLCETESGTVTIRIDVQLF